MRLSLTLILLAALSFTSCTGSSESHEQSLQRLADAIAVAGPTASPIVEEIDTGEGTKMVILAFANGDYQAWLVSPDGTVQGAGYQHGNQSYRLTPNGFTETR